MTDSPPTDPVLKQQLFDSGNASFDDGDYARALDSYHRITVLDPRDAAAWSALGLTLSNLDFPREAWRSYLLALNLAPSNPDTLWYATEFLFQIEDLALADLFLGRYLEVEQDAEKLGEARLMRSEIRAEAQSRGIELEAERGAEAETLLASETNRDAFESDEAGADPELDVEDADDEVVSQLSDEELEELAVSGRFIPPLVLSLRGFGANCRHCGAHIPADAPHCWSCKMIHFYE